MCHFRVWLLAMLVVTAQAVSYYRIAVSEAIDYRESVAALGWCRRCCGGEREQRAATAHALRDARAEFERHLAGMSF